MAVTDGISDQVRITEHQAQLAEIANTRSAEEIAAWFFAKAHEARAKKTLLFKNDDASIVAVKIGDAPKTSDPVLGSEPGAITEESERYQFYAERIAHAQRFKDLYRIIDSMRDEGLRIHGSAGIYTAQEIQEQLEDFRLSETDESDRVTRALGIRQKAVEMMRAGAGIKEALSVAELIAGISWVEPWQSHSGDRMALSQGLRAIVDNKHIDLIKYCPQEFNIREVTTRLTLHNADDLEDLFGMLRKLKTVPSRSGAPYNADEVIERIKAYQARISRGEEVDLAMMPSAYNLRELVQKLLQQERK